MEAPRQIPKQQIGNDLDRACDALPQSSQPIIICFAKWLGNHHVLARETMDAMSQSGALDTAARARLWIKAAELVEPLVQRAARELDGGPPLAQHMLRKTIAQIPRASHVQVLEDGAGSMAVFLANAVRDVAGKRRAASEQSRHCQAEVADAAQAALLRELADEEARVKKKRKKKARKSTPMETEARLLVARIMEGVIEEEAEEDVYSLGGSSRLQHSVDSASCGTPPEPQIPWLMPCIKPDLRGAASTTADGSTPCCTDTENTDNDDDHAEWLQVPARRRRRTSTPDLHEEERPRGGTGVTARSSDGADADSEHSDSEWQRVDKSRVRSKALPRKEKGLESPTPAASSAKLPRRPPPAPWRQVATRRTDKKVEATPEPRDEAQPVEAAEEKPGPVASPVETAEEKAEPCEIVQPADETGEERADPCEIAQPADETGEERADPCEIAQPADETGEERADKTVSSPEETAASETFELTPPAKAATPAATPETAEDANSPRSEAALASPSVEAPPEPTDDDRDLAALVAALGSRNAVRQLDLLAGRGVVSALQRQVACARHLAAGLESSRRALWERFQSRKNVRDAFLAAVWALRSLPTPADLGWHPRVALALQSCLSAKLLRSLVDAAGRRELG